MTQTAAQVKRQAAALKAEGIPVAKSKDGHVITRFWMKIWCFQENAAGQFVQCAAFVPVFHDSHTELAAVRIGPNPNPQAKNEHETILPIYVNNLQEWMDRVSPQLQTQAQTIGHREPDAGLLAALGNADREQREKALIEKYEADRKAAITAKRKATQTAKNAKPGNGTKKARK